MRRILVVEDGTEYTDAFERLAPASGAESFRFERAASLASAREALRSGAVDGLFLDVVFDRVPEADLCGDLEALTLRSGGDRRRAVRRLADLQGFYILDALAPELPGIPVVLAYDFTDEPARLEALRRRVPLLTGLADGAGIAEALALLAGAS